MLNLSEFLSRNDAVRVALRVDVLGEIKEKAVKEKVQLIQTPEELRNFARGIAVKRGICRKHEAKLGELKMVIQVNENLNIMSVPVGDETIIISTGPDVSIADIGRMVSDLTEAKLVLPI